MIATLAGALLAGLIAFVATSAEFRRSIYARPDRVRYWVFAMVFCPPFAFGVTWVLAHALSVFFVSPMAVLAAEAAFFLLLWPSWVLIQCRTMPGETVGARSRWSPGWCFIVTCAALTGATGSNWLMSRLPELDGPASAAFSAMF